MGSLAIVIAKSSKPTLPDLGAAMRSVAHRHDGDATIIEGPGFAVGFGRTDRERDFKAGCSAFAEFSQWSLDGELTPPPETTISPEELAAGNLESLESLAGNFALLMVDRERGLAYLARDPYALKPLYWAETESMVMAASEVKVLLAAGIPRGLARFGIVEYLCHGMPMGGRTVHDGIRVVPAGTLVRFDLANRSWSTSRFFALQQHVSVARYRQNVDLNESALIDAIERELHRSVDARLPADGPVGVFLSGGVDSSTVAALARRKRPDILGCVVDVAEPDDISERSYAQTAADHLGIELLAVRLDKQVFRENLVRTIAHVEWPLILENSVALFVAARELAERGVRVVIDGEGADTLFGMLTEVVRWDLLRHALSKKSEWLARVAEAVALRGLEAMERLGIQTSIPGQGRGLHLLMAGGFFDCDGSLAEAHRLLAHVPGGAGRDLEAALLNELFVDLPMHVHRLTSTVIAHGVDARLPFLDPGLIDLVVNLPLEWKVRIPRFGLKPVAKYILRRLAERYVPRDLVYRPKLGFEIPGRDYIGELPTEWLERGALVTRLDYPAAAVRDWYQSPRTGRDRFFYASCEIWAQLFWLGREVEEVEAEYLAANSHDN